MGARAGRFGAALAAFLLFPALVSFADKSPVTPEAAEALEKEKKYDQAMAVYEEWLKGNGADPRFPDVLRRCAELKKSPSAAVELYRNNLDSVTDPVRKRSLYREAALLLTLMGDQRSALEFFERAYEVVDVTTGADPWLSAVPALYVSVGEIGKAYDWIVRIDPVVRDHALRAELNYALLEIYLARRDLPHAERALAVLTAGYKDTAAYLKALFRIAVYHFSLGDKERAAPYRDALKKEFPGSIETQALLALWDGKAGGNVGLLADPNDILGGERFSADLVRQAAGDKGPQPSASPQPTVSPQTAVTPPPATSPPSASPPAAKGEWRVQVGSYAMRENAVYIARDLEKLKFQPEIVEAVVKGKTYYRVFVGTSLTADDAQLLLARLQDAGVGGYLYSGDK